MYSDIIKLGDATLVRDISVNLVDARLVAF